MRRLECKSGTAAVRLLSLRLASLIPSGLRRLAVVLAVVLLSACDGGIVGSQTRTTGWGVGGVSFVTAGASVPASAGQVPAPPRGYHPHTVRQEELLAKMRSPIDIEVFEKFVTQNFPDGGGGEGGASGPTLLSYTDVYGAEYVCGPASLLDEDTHYEAAENSRVGAAGAVEDDGRDEQVPSGTLVNDDPPSSAEPGHQLDYLASVCAELRKGWWTYRWCHLGEVRQFHLEGNKRTQDWSLGSFDEIATQVLNGDSSETAEDQNPLPASRTKPPAHMFTGGQQCDETSAGRKSQVHFSCCDPAKVKAAAPRPSTKKKGATAGETKRKRQHGGAGQPHGEDVVAALISVEEPEVCSYVLNICTKHACARDAEAAATSIEGLLAPLKGSCFRRQDGWWTYEFCHGKHLRQMHIHVEEDGSSTTHEVQSSYDLGVMTSAEAQPVDASEEAKRVIRPASSPDTVAYAVPYGNGANCEITGGPRAAEIHYVCMGVESPTHLVSVKEDSTCHYIAVVHTPYLCQHPKFSAIQEQTVRISCRLRAATTTVAEHLGPQS